MRLSRRDALRAGGGLLAGAGVAGCVERRVTRRETRVRDSTTWVLTPDVDAALDQEAFETYVGEREDDYGDSGVWGLDGQPAAAFQTAYVGRLGIPQDSAGRSSLDPDALELESPLLVADAAVAVYQVDGAYRYWLWLAADGTADRLARDVEVSVLSTRLSFRNGSLGDGAQVSGTGDEASASLGTPPQGSFPLADDTTDVEATIESGEGGSYSVDWSGSVAGAQSINGVCEEQREGQHDFRWSVAAGYSLTEEE